MWDNPNNLPLTHQALGQSIDNTFLPWIVGPRLVGKLGLWYQIVGNFDLNETKNKNTTSWIEWLSFINNNFGLNSHSIHDLNKNKKAAHLAEIKPSGNRNLEQFKIQVDVPKD